MTISDGAGKSFIDLMTNDKLSPNERVQQVIDLYTAETKRTAEEPSRVWNTTVEQWTKEISADKEIGTGDTARPLKPEALRSISQLIDKFGGQELRTALDLTGAGSSPAVIRALHKMSQKLVEPSSYVQGNGPTKAMPQDAAHAMYPDLQ